MADALRVSKALDHFQALSVTPSNIIRWTLRLGKFAVFILFLLNIRSWPLFWHFRLFRPAFARRIRYRLLRLRTLFLSSQEKRKIEEKWLESLSPVGENPFSKVVSYRTWASPDDSDFNGHLSNSSYAKILDGGRFKAAIEMFPLIFIAGGWMALAATHYHFIREIPIFSSYEIRTSIVSWDEKWLYIMSRFVTKTSGKDKKKLNSKTISSVVNGELLSQIAPLRTSGPEISSTRTPFIVPTPEAVNMQSTLNAVSMGLANEEPDGATLNTIVVTQLCFKVGRITVPPGLVLAANGFTGLPGCSMSSPHPQWAEAKKVFSVLRGGSLRNLKELFVGGWRDIPESERWWDRALGEATDAQRVKNLSMVEGLRKGMLNARSF